MSARNNHIDQFIEYYCNLEIPPEYALLIKGAWGSGKTHLVTETIDRLKVSNEGLDVLTISLYGIASVSDIEDQFFKLLHPVLSNKNVALAGKLIKGFVKGALKVDIDGDGTADGTAKVEIPEIDLSDYLKDPKNCVLIFDDLERSSMPLKDLLGYINYFVEKEGYKVIIIGDEEKIKKKNEDDSSNYDLVKEKLIGKTLKVDPDVDFVFDIFKDTLIQDMNLKDELVRNKENIINQFDRSKFKNLRSLRKFFLDFERFYLSLYAEVKDKDELISHVISLYAILSFEVHGGTILPEEFSSLMGSSTVTRRMFREDKKGEKTKFDLIEEKYNISFYEPLISIDAWVDLFDRSFISHEDINENLKASQYFQEENTPAWVKMKSIYDVDDDVFETAYTTVEEQLENYEISQPGVLKQLMGIYLMLSDEGIAVELNRAEILDKFTSYTKSLFDDDKAELDEYTYTSINDEHGAFTISGYFSQDLTEFKEYSNYLNKRVLEAQQKLQKVDSDEITIAMKENPMSLYVIICHANDSRSKYHSKPIMQYIDIKDFFTEFMTLPNKHKRRVIDALYHRYKEGFFAEKLIEEYDWLNQFKIALETELENKEGKITSILLRQSIERIEGSLLSLGRFLPKEELDIEEVAVEELEEEVNSSDDE